MSPFIEDEMPSFDWQPASAGVTHSSFGNARVVRPYQATADLDALTELATRRRLVDSLGAVLERMPTDPFALFGPSVTRPALILVKVNRFRAINDSLGPAIGDALLYRVAQRLRTIIPRSLLIARVSGVEFGVLLRDTNQAASISAKLVEFLSRPYVIDGNAVTVGISIGVATAGAHGKNTQDVLHAASLALHQAEVDGRGRVHLFDPSMRTQAMNRHSLERDFRISMAMEQVELRQALKTKQFEVHYQPQIRLADGRLTGFEALVRWRHPERGLVSPNDFIPLAEDIGLIDLLGEWVLQTACNDAMGWTVPHSRSPLRVAVNVSPMQLREGPALLNAIRRTLTESGLPVERLEIELTEAALAMNVSATLTAIRSLGLTLALDDFGTGYSSLGRLRDHPFSRIKIDRSFVTELGSATTKMGGSPADWMIRAIASLGAGLGVATVAEGIETQGQLEIARDAGCTEMQGFLISRPVPAVEVQQMIHRLTDEDMREDHDNAK